MDDNSLPLTDAPVGSITAFAGPEAKIPRGWLLCDGRMLNRNDPAFKPLFDVIGTGWGGDGVDGFFIPDLQGIFLRGVSGASLRDQDAPDRYALDRPNPGNRGNNVGSYQRDTVGPHQHGMASGGSFPSAYGHSSDRLEGGGDWERTVPYMASVAVLDSGAGIGKETRPINAYVFWIIRAS